MTSFNCKTFQGLILQLQDYWSRQGCVIVQPLDLEVGAGTFHPMTFLRSIGPEPISSAYVQPCRRPTDGRYGENPNRLQHYYQFQVMLKPSPKNIQELYLNSLKELGIDPLVLEDVSGLHVQQIHYRKKDSHKLWYCISEGKYGYESSIH